MTEKNDMQTIKNAKKNDNTNDSERQKTTIQTIKNDKNGDTNGKEWIYK